MRLLVVDGAMLSHPGSVRDTNEDAIAYHIGEPSDGPAGADLIALVADGMGGHAAGEIASRMAAEMILPYLRATVLALPEALAVCMADANEAIVGRGGSDPACAGMGTTCTILCLRDGAVFLAHIGDSRAYLYRAGELCLLSADHSVVGELVRAGLLSAAEAKNSPDRNVIMRALGLKRDAEPLIWDAGRDVQENDCFVLCSDGLTDLVDDDAIGAAVARLPPRAACQVLMDAALAAGGFDNISVGIFSVQARRDKPEMTG